MRRPSTGKKPWKPDPAGNFLIGLLRGRDLAEAFGAELSAGPDEIFITAIHRTIPRRAGIGEKTHSGSENNDDVKVTVFIGRSSEEIMDDILTAGETFISDIGHASYLAGELKKAEICLKTGRSYAQDDDFRRRKQAEKIYYDCLLFTVNS